MMPAAATLFALFLVAPTFHSTRNALDWLHQAASLPIPDSLRSAEAVVLLQEHQVQVDKAGSVTFLERRVVRVGSVAGKREAVARVLYRTDTGRVRRLQAWLIRPSGAVVRFDSNQIVEVALLNGDLYNEARVQVIAAGDAAEPGAVFGYEAESEDRSIFSQFEWQAQDRLPTLRSRFWITVPNGWRVAHRTFNHAPLEPVVTGSTWAWQLKDLPRLEDELAAPPSASIVTRVAIRWFPGPGAARKPHLRLTTFDSWADVAGWLAELTAAPSEPVEPVMTKARQLVADARTELDSVRAIARFVQSVRYAEIAMGLGRGGGYRPHDAAEVMAKSYGDCKDKASLMRAMLHSVGIPAWLVVASAGDPDYVRAEWPSPHQFDHCIVGIGLRTPTGVAACVRDSAVGRLLMFDPTDPSTVVGDLPSGEQGGLALVVSPDSRTLVRLPALDPTESRLERNVSVTLTADGSAKGTILERSFGQAAAGERRLRRQSSAEYRRITENWIARGAGSTAAATVSTVDDSASGRFALNVRFEIPRFAQRLGDSLLMFRPAIVSRSAIALTEEKPRRLPIVLPASVFRESVTVALPPGFVADELPPPVSLVRSFGTYSSNCIARGGQVLNTRAFELKRSRLPADRYPEVRDFFDRMRAGENSPVVLGRR